MKLSRFACGTVLASVLAAPAFAGVILDATEVGGDVVISGGGTLDLGAWTLLAGGVFAEPVINSVLVLVGPTGFSTFYQTPVNFAGPGSIPAMPALADSGTGDIFGFNYGAIFLIVPQNYISGSGLAGDATFLNETFASMGLVEGESYTWTWGTEGVDEDFFILNIVGDPSDPGGPGGPPAKVLICHVDPDCEDDGPQVISISERAVEAHLAHGDCLAPEGAEIGDACPDLEECTYPECIDPCP